MRIKGKIHIYFGDGKGKTTAAVGLAVRAAGAGMKVAFVQFLKKGEGNEVSELKRLGIHCSAFGRGVLLRSPLEADRKLAEEGLEAAKAYAQSGEYDVLILDELLDSISLGLSAEEEILELLRAKQDSVELVITGHKLPGRLADAADYITEMCSRKHPYESGLLAREGIEF